MEYTQNYALRKPGLNEYANVGDLNFNADKIDSQMKKNQDVDGEVYDPTSTAANAYEAGDYVINPEDGLMYVCNGTTYGTWDATKWEHTTEFEELQKAMASGGESELADLNDVEITNPTEGQALLYDPTSLKWHNSDLPDADVTKTASGNPIEFEDGADAPLVKCTTAIQGNQDLHGYDKPWVGGAGKNLVDESTLDMRDVTGTSTYRAGLAPVELAPGDYTISYSSKSSSLGLYITIPDDNYSSSQITQSPFTFTLSATKNVMIRSSASAVNAWDVVDLMLETGTVATSYEPYSNICPITAYTEGEIEVRGKNLIDESTVVSGEYLNDSGVPTSVAHGAYYAQYIPVRSGTYKISFTKASDNLNFYLRIHGYNSSKVWQSLVYKSSSTIVEGGFYSYSFTVPTGISFVRFSFGDDISNVQIEEGATTTAYEPYKGTTHTATFTQSIYQGNADFIGGTVGAGNDGEEWIVKDLGDYTWSKGGTNRFYTVEPLAKYPSSASIVGDIISEWYDVKTANETYSGVDGISIGDSSGVARIHIYDSAKASMTAEQFKTAVTGCKVAFVLADNSPQQITVSNLPIKSLFGYNHIESSTGEMEIEYFPAKEQPLIDLIPEASNMHTYSTEEHAVGTWIDGETIYEQTYTYSGTGAANPFQTTIDMTGKNLIEVIPHYARYTYNGGQGYGECVGSELFYSNSNVLNIHYVDSIPYTLTVSSYLGSTNSYDIAFTLRYTKTSSNNRSLAKGEPTEEVKEEPEEIKEEEVEEVKEEETKEEGEVNER